MKATKIIHKNENRIKVDFPFDSKIAATLKQIIDARWSQSLKAWHIPYTEEAFKSLKNLFPEVENENKFPVSQIIDKPPGLFTFHEKGKEVE